MYKQREKTAWEQTKRENRMWTSKERKQGREKLRIKTDWGQKKEKTRWVKLREKTG